MKSECMINSHTTLSKPDANHQMSLASELSTTQDQAPSDLLHEAISLVIVNSGACAKCNKKIVQHQSISSVVKAKFKPPYISIYNHRETVYAYLQEY